MRDEEASSPVTRHPSLLTKFLDGRRQASVAAPQRASYRARGAEGVDHGRMLSRAADDGDQNVLGALHHGYRRVRAGSAELLFPRDPQPPLDVFLREAPERQ